MNKAVFLGFLFFFSLAGMVSCFAKAAVTFECKVRPVYCYRTDGKSGREALLTVKGDNIQGAYTVEVPAKKKKETSTLHIVEADSAQSVLLLPEGVGTTSQETVSVTLSNVELKQEITVPPMRYWNVYLYNHSHVDIGYTNTHKNVKTLHKNNIIEGIKLAEETKNFLPVALFVRLAGKRQPAVPFQNA